MDLLQLTVLALNLAKEHTQLALSQFQVHSPRICFDCLFFFVYFILMIFICPPDVWGVINLCLHAMGDYVFSSL